MALSAVADDVGGGGVWRGALQRPRPSFSRCAARAARLSGAVHTAAARAASSSVSASTRVTASATSAAFVWAKASRGKAPRRAARPHRAGRLRKCEEPKVRVAVELAQAACRRCVPRRRGEIEAPAEERAGTGQDDGAHGVVGRGGGKRGSEVGEQALVERVGRRPVEGEKTDAAFSVVGPDGAHAPGWLRAGRTVR